MHDGEKGETILEMGNGERKIGKGKGMLSSNTSAPFWRIKCGWISFGNRQNPGVITGKAPFAVLLNAIEIQGHLQLVFCFLIAASTQVPLEL